MITIIIPAYNEESNICGVVESIGKISNNRWEIIVVDDGSTDKTSELVEKYEFIKLIRHNYNKGNGSSIKTGINNAKGEYIVVVDADNQHNPVDIEKLVDNLKEYDLVVGARNGDSEQGLVRTIGNFLLKKVAGFLVEKDIPDLTSGFRAFKKDKILKFMHLYPQRFSFPTTSILSFISAGYDVKFVPVKMSKRGKDSKTKVNVLRDGFKFFLIILRIIVLFNPLKIFFPISLFLFITGTAYGVLYIFMIRHIPAGAVLTILSSIIIFFFGLIADQISCLRREIR